MAFVFVFACIPAEFGEVYATTTIEQDQAAIQKLEAIRRANAAKREELKKYIESLGGEYQNAFQQKLVLENNIFLIETEISTVEGLIAGYEKRLADLALEQYKQQEQLDEYYGIYAEILTYYYKYGEVSSIEMLLSSDSISDFLTRLDYLKYVMEYNNTITDTIRLSKEKLDDTSKLYQEAQEKLATEKAELVKTKEELNGQIAELENVTATMGDNLNLTQDQIDALLKEDADLLKEIEEIRKQMTDKIIAGESDFAWPIDSAYWSDSNVVITCAYGNRIDPIYGGQEFHNGIDIKAPKNTPIQVVKSGVVTKSEWWGGYGNVVIVAHSDGTSTLYAHCEKLLVSKGATVMQGQVIAKVGTTGKSSGYHLHFTVYNNKGGTDNPVDHLDPTFVKVLNKRGLKLK